MPSDDTRARAGLTSQPGKGRVAAIRRFETIVRVAGDATGGQVAVLEHRLPIGTLAMPRHSHAGASEVLHVQAGRLSVELGGVVHVLKEGDIVVIPAGARHTCWVDPDAPLPATFLAILTPAGLEEYYAEVAAAIAPGGKPEMDAVLAAGERHGVEVEMESLYELIERHTLQLS